VLISLKTLIDQLEEDRELKPLLSSFCCAQDADIEQFFHHRAVEFERLSKARTYLVCDQEELRTKKISELTVYGYFSLALKILTVPAEVSNRVRKELDGFSAKLRGEQISDFSCYLIGQLSRNSRVDRSSLSGTQLLTFAGDVISTAVEAVGGRYMMIECRDNANLIRFYEQNHFSEIARIPDQEQPMVQMIRKIQ
jgi:hypothetical protein